MSEDNKETSDDGPPTTDAAQQKKQPLVNNENKDDIISSRNIIIEDEQRETTNEKQETRNSDTHHSELITQDMEVHHHTHESHGKKTWNNYFWEFLMLFLAVFCGFMAENFREHQVENAKEKEYMVSMLSDIKEDTVSANRTISVNRIFIAGEDSVLHFLAGNLLNQDTAEMALLSFYKYCLYETFMRSSDGTISQLKNNGGLRLLRNKEVIDKINYYYNEMTVLKSQQNSIDDFLVIIDKQAGEVFNYKANKKFIDLCNLSEVSVYELPTSAVTNWLAHGSPTMLTTDIKMLSPFMSNLSYHMGLMQSYIGLLKKQEKVAIELIQAIKTGYHLENE